MREEALNRHRPGETRRPELPPEANGRHSAGGNGPVQGVAAHEAGCIVATFHCKTT
jgi:hypothetical protein